METTRRGFLRLLGIGAAAGAAASAGGSLFTEGIGSMLVGAADHYVYDKSTRGAVGPILSPDACAHFFWHSGPIEGNPYASPVSSLRLRNPKRTEPAHSYRDMYGKMIRVPAKPAPPWCPAGEPSVYQVGCPVGPGQEPHVEFFIAASRLRDKINDDVQALKLPSSLVLVTTVEVPIMAFPQPDHGFYLETQISQFAVLPNQIENSREALSLRGEVPIEAPGDIEFKYLMLMQEQLSSMGMLDGHNRSRLHDRPTFTRAWERVAGDVRSRGFRKA